jgi:hypothetical protein
VRELIEELRREGHVTKIQHRVSGPHRGGIPFQRGTLFHLLKNRIYLGEIVHKGVAHPGEHAAIVDRALWDRVQATLAERGSGASRRRHIQHPSALTSKLFDGRDRPMTPSHTVKANRRYRYYVTRAEQLDAEPAWRVSANDLERIVTDSLVDLLRDQSRLHDLFFPAGGDATAVQAMFKKGEITAATSRGGMQGDRIDLVQALISRVTLHEDRIDLLISRAALRRAIAAVSSGTVEDDMLIELSSPAVRVRKGHEIRLIIPSSAPPERDTPRRDQKLIQLLAEAHAARATILGSPNLSLNRIAADAGRCRTRLGRLFMLSHLAPSIVIAIMEGRQPASLNTRTLHTIDLPIGWKEQRAMLGFA